jgi:hypothetical protein
MIDESNERKHRGQEMGLLVGKCIATTQAVAGGQNL